MITYFLILISITLSYSSQCEILLFNNTITLLSSQTSYVNTNINVYSEYCQYYVISSSNCSNVSIDDIDGDCFDILFNDTYIKIETPNIIDICNFTYNILLCDYGGHSSNNTGIYIFIGLFCGSLVIIIYIFLLYCPNKSRDEKNNTNQNSKINHDKQINHNEQVNQHKQINDMVQPNQCEIYDDNGLVNLDDIDDKHSI